MTMTNDVLEQLNYLKLKSAYSYLFNITGPSYRIKDKLNPKKTENT